MANLGVGLGLVQGLQSGLQFGREEGQRGYERDRQKYLDQQKEVDDQRNQYVQDRNFQLQKDQFDFNKTDKETDNARQEARDAATAAHQSEQDKHQAKVDAETERYHNSILGQNAQKINLALLNAKNSADLARITAQAKLDGATNKHILLGAGRALTSLQESRRILEHPEISDAYKTVGAVLSGHYDPNDTDIKGKFLTALNDLPEIKADLTRGIGNPISPEVAKQHDIPAGSTILNKQLMTLATDDKYGVPIYRVTVHDPKSGKNFTYEGAPRTEGNSTDPNAAVVRIPLDKLKEQGEAGADLVKIHEMYNVPLSHYDDLETGLVNVIAGLGGDPKKFSGYSNSALHPPSQITTKDLIKERNDLMKAGGRKMSLAAAKQEVLANHGLDSWPTTQANLDAQLEQSETTPPTIGSTNGMSPELAQQVEALNNMLAAQQQQPAETDE